MSEEVASAPGSPLHDSLACCAGPQPSAKGDSPIFAARKSGQSPSSFPAAPKPAKVFLTGGDRMGWAIDEDYQLTRRALTGVVQFCELADCEVVHTMWWESVLDLPAKELVGKRVICHVPGEPHRYLTLPPFRRAAEKVGLWVVRSRQAADQFTALGSPNVLIPYTVDTTVFRSLPKDSPRLRELCAAWNIPAASYLIGSFQRDTEGRDLASPKLVKGPDVFVEIVTALGNQGLPVHVVLAGPRRHWVRRTLAERGVPFTFVGQSGDADDLTQNSQSRETLNLLYNLIDLYLVSSRSEGGPQSVMEAAAARCKIVSSAVGLAFDVLDPRCVYRSPTEAVAAIADDIRHGSLAGTVEDQHRRIQAAHCPSAVAPLYRRMFDDIICSVAPYAGQGAQASAPEPARRGIAGLFRRATARVFRHVRARLSGPRALCVGLWHQFHEPPYGGGNQFMLALRKALVARGVQVVENRLRRDVDVYLLNSVHFDVDQFLAFRRKDRLRVVHRIDGPISLARGHDREKDELCFRLNAQFASATVLQSAWTYHRIAQMGYKPVRPVILHNAVDPHIFHRRGRIPFDRTRKVRLISTSWSDNPRKGGALCRWMEDHLDWDRFQYTFVGNVSEPLTKIRRAAPVPSEELAGLLRQHDIYVFLSRIESCSNALLEAMHCGLPVLYANGSSNPELVGFGGLPFDTEADILPRLDELTENYEMFQNVIAVPSMDEVAEQYLTLLRECAGE